MEDAESRGSRGVWEELLDGDHLSYNGNSSAISLGLDRLHMGNSTAQAQLTPSKLLKA